MESTRLCHGSIVRISGDCKNFFPLNHLLNFVRQRYEILQVTTFVRKRYENLNTQLFFSSSSLIKKNKAMKLSCNFRFGRDWVPVWREIWIFVQSFGNSEEINLYYSFLPRPHCNIARVIVRGATEARHGAPGRASNLALDESERSRDSLLNVVILSMLRGYVNRELILSE